MKFKARLAIFFAMLALSAGLAWLAGYDFDQRGPGVAWWASMAIMVAALAAYMPENV